MPVQNESRLLRTGPSLLAVDDHRFLIMAEDRPGQHDGEVPNGLVEVHGPVVRVRTGIAAGELFLEADFRADAPDGVELDAWDEVVEVSAELPEAGARLSASDDECPWHWPDVNQQGPGWYRLRFHCRGRDRRDGDEHHKLVVWPAPRSGTMLYKLTDETGRVARITP